MSHYKPYDINELEEIVIFDFASPRGVIELSRDGKYINLIKYGEEDKRYYRYNLQTDEFERINFYKTVSDKITKVAIENITGWFTECKLITKDMHFGRLVVFAKNSNAFDRYSSPVRFIQQLGHRYIKNLEQWEALGLCIDEIYLYFGDGLVYDSWTGDTVDHRKDIYLDRYKKWHSLHIYYPPSECSKEALAYIKSLKHISIHKLHNIIENYNHGEFEIEKKLKELEATPEYSGIFSYEETRWNGGGYHNVLDSDKHTAMRIRTNMYSCISEFSLDIVAFCNWIKKQANVEKNDIEYLFDTNHYRDYLRCEYELQDGSYSKMVKYPNNFRTEFHKAHVEFEAVKGDFDLFKFQNRKKDNEHLEHNGVKFCMIIPEHPDEIKNEASCLQHCVRSYIKPMQEGETLIMFLRDKKERDIPLITVEVKNNVVRQAYGVNDSKPKKEHLEYLRHWASMKGIEMGCWR